MKFDAHGDILTDVAIELEKGNDIWEKYHKPLYNEAEISASIFVNFTDPFSKRQLDNFERINEYALPYFKKRSDINIVYSKDDFCLDKLNVIFGIEGMNAVANKKQLKNLYNLGYRHFSMTWNEGNHFAGGVESTANVTDLGLDLVKYGIELGMIIDFAHLNKASFMKLAKEINKPIFFSHGNVHELCKHPRNLDDEQLRLVVDSGGVIGLSAISGFLNNNREKASIDDFVKHVLLLVDRYGIDCIGFGFDFCHYLGSHEASNDVEGLKKISDVNKLKELFLKNGLSEEQIDKIFFGNMMRVVKQYLK